MGDVEIQRGRFSLIQPTINPLFNTRQIGVSLLTWTESANFNAKADQAYYEYLKNYWSQNILSKAKIAHGIKHYTMVSLNCLSQNLPHHSLRM